MAATDLERLVVQLSADIKKYESAINRAQGITNKQFGAIEKRAVSLNKNLSSSFSSFGETAVKAFALIGGAKGFQVLSDSATNITNALKVAGLSGTALTSTLGDLYTVALKNHAPIESLAQLYSRMSINQKELGASSKDLIGFTDIVGKSLRVSGTSAQEAAGPLLQLSQALGSGTVHAEEFNSILEGMPAFAQAAAKGIKQANGSVAELKKLVNNGQLSSRALFDGAIAGSADLDQKLQGSATTIGQAFTDLQTSLTRAVGNFDTASGSAKGVATAIETAATAIDGIKFDNTVAGIQAIIGYLEDATKGAGNLWDKLKGVAEAMNDGQSLTASPLNLVTNTDTETEFWNNYNSAGGASDNAKAQNDLIQQRIDLEKQLNDLRSGPVPFGNGSGAVTGVLMQLDDLRDKTAKAKDEINSLPAPTGPQQGPQDLRKFQKPEGFKDEMPPQGQIDLTDEKYKTTATKTKKTGGGADAKAYDRETRQVKERTDVLNAQTAAQAKLNPYLNDYGYAAEKAATAQELLSAAQRSGTVAGKELKDVNQLLSGDFSQLTPAARAQAEAMLALADASGQASAKSQQLQDSQEKLKQTMEEWRATSKDATEGFVKDLIAGKSATEALGGALEKLGDKLLDSAFDGIFGATGTNNWFSSLFSGLGLKDGGSPLKLAGGGSVFGKGGPRADKIPAMLSNGEFVVNSAATKKNRPLLEAINSGRALRLANGGMVRAPSMPRASSIAPRAANDNASITYAPVIDARGADAAAVARIQETLERDKREFHAKVVTTMRTAQKTRNFR